MIMSARGFQTAHIFDLLKYRETNSEILVTYYFAAVIILIIILPQKEQHPNI